MTTSLSERAAAFNAGVLAVLSIAKASADAITATSKRHVHEAFAVAALEQLASDGRALLIMPPQDPVDAPPDKPPSAPAPAASKLQESA